MENLNSVDTIRILDIPSDTNYWFVRANSGAKFYSDFKINNFIAVDSNKMKLKNLYSLPHTLKEVDDALLEKYRSVFLENDLSLFDSSPAAKKMDELSLKSARSSIITKSTNRAKRVFTFVENLKIGDFVVVPSASSKKFLIGVITSDCFDRPVNHKPILNKDGKFSYDTSTFEFKRQVLWIKELNKTNFPSALDWTKTAHQSVINITSNADDLNPYISNFYKFKGNFYYRLSVNSEDNISSLSWLNFQNSLHSIVGNDLHNVYQKQKVQSPGDILIFVNQNYFWLIPLIVASLFGEIKINKGPINLEIPGIIKYFSRDEKLKRQLEIKSKQATIANINSQTTNNNIDTLVKAERLLQSDNIEITESTRNLIKNSIDQNEENQLKIDENFAENKLSHNFDSHINLDNSTIKSAKSDLQLSNTDYGKKIPYEDQKDNIIK